MNNSFFVLIIYIRLNKTFSTLTLDNDNRTTESKCCSFELTTTKVLLVKNLKLNCYYFLAPLQTYTADMLRSIKRKVFYVSIYTIIILLTFVFIIYLYYALISINITVILVRLFDNIIDYSSNSIYTKKIFIQ